MLRLVLCLLFYSAVSLAYITWLTPISEGRSILKMLQKPVFYHLWFFFALIGIYLLSPLIDQGRQQIDADQRKEEPQVIKHRLLQHLQD